MSARSKLRDALQLIDDAVSKLARMRATAGVESDARSATSALEDAKRRIDEAIRDVRRLEKRD